LTIAKTSATRATAIRTHGAMLVSVSTEKTPAMNRAYTNAVTAMKTSPTTTVVRREPPRRVRASRTESTQREHGLKPSTRAMSTVLSTSDCRERSTVPRNGSERAGSPAARVWPPSASPSSSTPGGDADDDGVAAPGDGLGEAGPRIPAPASGHPLRAQAATTASIGAAVRSSEKPIQ